MFGALQNDLIDEPLDEAGFDYVDARWIIERGTDADKRRLITVVIEDVDLFDREGEALPLETVRVRWRVEPHALCPCGSGKTYGDCCGR